MSKLNRIPSFIRHVRFCYKNVLPNSLLPLTGVLLGFILNTCGLFTKKRCLIKVHFKDLSVNLNAFSGEISGFWENFQEEKYGPDAGDLPGYCVFDVGGNAGFFSMRQILLRKEKLKLFTFEPDPAVFERLSAHLRQCNLGRNAQISVHNFACGSISGTAGFFRDGSCLSHVTTDPDNGRKHIDVQIDTLDNVVQAQKVAHINLMKIDVEGHETEVLKGASKVALPITDKIVLQYHPGQYENVCKLLEGAGFKPAGGNQAKETAFFSRVEK